MVSIGMRHIIATDVWEWANYLLAENIWIEPEVMKYYGREEIGVAIPEGGGYIGTLNVYHELHCIVGEPQVCSCAYLNHWLKSPT